METYIAITTLVTVAAVTPGPNNLIVMQAAARGGLVSALPAIAGIVFGTLVLLCLSWLGAAAAIEAEPRLRRLMTLAGCLYLAWLGAALIRQSRGRTATAPSRLPSGVLGMAFFQLCNPKSWVLVLTALAAASAGAGVGPRLLADLGFIFVTVTVCCLLLWSLAGRLAARMLESARGRAWFDRGMGALLVVSALMLAV